MTQNDDRVFITAEGRHYHYDPHCPGITRGQDEAERTGKQTHPVQQVARAFAEQQHREACTRCVR